MSQQFRRAFRISDSSQYTSVFNHANFKISSQHLTFIIKTNNLHHSRMGVIVGKKSIKLAVHRNIVKRFIRENFRKGIIRNLGYDIIVLVRGSLIKLTKEQMQEDVDCLVKRVIAKSYQSKPKINSSVKEFNKA